MDSLRRAEADAAQYPGEKTDDFYTDPLGYAEPSKEVVAAAQDFSASERMGVVDDQTLPEETLAESGVDHVGNDQLRVWGFSSGSSELTLAFEAALTAFAATTDAHAGVIVTGYTDSAGSAGRNRRLARQRAQAAANVLIEVGVPASAVEVVGKGTMPPLEKEQPGAAGSHARARNRRVEIVRTGSGAAGPGPGKSPGLGAPGGPERPGEEVGQAELEPPIPRTRATRPWSRPRPGRASDSRTSPLRRRCRRYGRRYSSSSTRAPRRTTPSCSAGSSVSTRKKAPSDAIRIDDQHTAIVIDRLKQGTYTLIHRRGKASEQKVFSKMPNRGLAIAGGLTPQSAHKQYYILVDPPPQTSDPDLRVTPVDVDPIVVKEPG